MALGDDTALRYVKLKLECIPYQGPDPTEFPFAN